MPVKVPITDTKIATVGISVVVNFCRNRYVTSTTSRTVNKRVSKVSSSDALMKSVVSCPMT